MKKYILKRITISAITLLMIVFLLFLMLEFMPGTPFNDERLTSGQKAVLTAQYGLDQPIPIRFAAYVKNMFSGNFGVSYTISQNTEVTQLLKHRLPITLQIGGQAVLLGTLIGLLLGILAALLRKTAFNTLATIISVAGVSLPSYVFALILSYYLGYKLGWFPMLYNKNAVITSTILPTISLSMLIIATVTRFTKTEMLSVLNSEYMLFAQTKGLSGAGFVARHALRNTMIPVITALAPLIVGIMTGSLMVEEIFSIPGIGSLLVTAIQSNDYNVIITIMFLYSAMYIGIMLVVDVMYCIIDPRIRISDGGNYE